MFVLVTYTLKLVLLAIIKLVCLLVAIAYFTLAERKVMAAIQRRVGPNVVGPLGLLQPLADGLKLAGKEFVIPTYANSRIFLAAAMTTLMLALLAWMAIPFALQDYSEGLPLRTLLQAAMLDVNMENTRSAKLAYVLVTVLPRDQSGGMRLQLGAVLLCQLIVMGFLL